MLSLSLLVPRDMQGPLSVSVYMWSKGYRLLFDNREKEDKITNAEKEETTSISKEDKIAPDQKWIWHERTFLH